MNVIFHPEADDEFQAAIGFYEASQAGLGDEFIREVESALDRIVKHPSTWPELEGSIRRCLVKRFPFGLLYEATDEQIVILAVMHLRRAPDYWKNRD